MNSRNLFSHLTSLISKPKVIFIILSITVSVLVIDTSINRIYYRSINELPLDVKVILFLVIAIISWIGQFSCIQFVHSKSIHIRNKNVLGIKTLFIIVSIVQFVLIVLFLILVLQMIIEIQYNLLLVMFSIGINSIFGGSLLILLASKFFSWSRQDSNVVALLYGISSAIIASNIVFTGLIVFDFLMTKPEIIQPHFGILTPYSDRGYLTYVLNYGYSISSISGFIVAWISTILLLHQFSVQWRGKAHWIIVAAPMAYFLIQFQPLFLNTFSEFVKLEPVSYGIVYTLIITYSKPIGGLIFGAAFWAITKSLRRNSIMMDYTTISAYGFVLLFISNNALVLSSAPYPPFGLATINFLGLSCYMVLVGIFLSALSLSQDTKLRLAIRKAVEKKSNLLDSIGVSEMTRFLERETLVIYNNLTEKMNDEIGITPLSPTEAKEYCNTVIKELENSKRIEDKA
jgi:hypothetical protein